MTHPQPRDKMGKFTSETPPLTEHEIQELKSYYKHNRIDFKHIGGNTYIRTWKWTDGEQYILFTAVFMFLIAVIF